MKKKSVCMLTAAMAVSMAAGAATAFISAPKAQAKAETLTTTVAKYDFSDPNDLGKDVSGNGNHLTVHSADGEEVPVQDTERGGVRFGGKSVLYAAGEREDKKGYDFADYLVNEKFTVSLDFWMDSTMDMDNKVYRPSIFALWGHMYTGNFDTNIGGLANNRASSLTMDRFDYPNGVPTPYLRFAWADGTSPDWGTDISVTSDAWHTFTLSWDPATRTVTGTMDGNAYFTNTAMNEDTFVSNVARFTLGGYYTDPLNGGRGITSTDGNYCAFEGNIRNVTITKTETGNEFNKLMSYDFTDAEVGKANESAYDLVEWGEGATYDSEKGALYSPKSSVLVPKGFNRIANQKNDFWDYMAGEDFTVSTSFMLPKTIAESEKAEGRGVLFSLWGLWAGTTYGGTADCNLVSSSVIYDAYASGADKANIRIGFLYQNGTDDSGNPTTENGWWSNKEGAVTTDEFHTLAISMKGLTCTVYLDGVQFASFDCYAGNAWGNVGTTFALGGAAGVGGTAGGSAYFKYFDVYDFAMSGSELSALNRGQLNLTEAAYISSAAEVSSAVTVIKNTPNDEILAESPTVSDVTVTLSDGSTPTAKAIWTGVEKQGDNVYLVGTILAAGASNPNGVKARMPVTFVAQAKEVSLTLDGTIGLNYYFSLIDTVVAEESEAVLIWKAEDNSVLGTVELKGYTVKGTESKTDWYKFTYAVAAKDYKNKITAEISDGETVLESVTFSAEDYFTVVESGEYEEKLKTLVSATKNYCEAARAFFANESVTENESAVTVSDEYKISAEGVLPEGISNVTVSMVLESDTELRVYFKAASIDGIAFTIDGAEAIPVKSGSYYYLSLKNVTATQLSVRHAFTIGSFTVRYGALSYVNEVLTIENPETVYANVAAWKNVVKAIYAYSAAAQNYFA